MRVGIDISINSTAVCTLDESGYKWYNYSPNISHRSKKFLEFTSLNCCQIISFDKDKRKQSDLTLSESIETKLKTFNNIYETIKNSNIDFNGAKSVCVEGPSYNSKGRSQIDLVVCNHYISFKLISDGLKNLTFIPPSNVKKLAGKGNYNKLQMFDAFKNNVLEDKDLEDSEFYQLVKTKVITTKAIPKPIDDLIDAYFVLKSYTNS